jgi:hypothetical protein
MSLREGAGPDGAGGDECGGGFDMENACLSIMLLDDTAVVGSQKQCCVYYDSNWPTQHS